MLEQLLDPKGTYNEITLATVGDWPDWLVICLVIVSALILFFCWRNSNTQPTRARIMLWGCRLISILLIWLMFLEVSFRLEKVQQTPSRIAVLVDQSRSMTLPISASDPRPRIDRVAEYLSDHQRDFESLGEDHRIDYYGFGSSITAIDVKKPMLAVESDTDFLKAITYLGDADTQRELVGAIVLSDGVDTRRPSTGGLPAPIRDAVDTLSVPIYTVEIAKSDATVDLAVVDVAHDDFAFVRNAVSFEVSLSARGHKDIPVAVRLEENGQEIGKKIVQLKSEQNDYTVAFELVPDTRGQSVFKVSVDSIAGERVLDNNAHAFTVQVIRDKIRVLQVVGRPSWDVRSLRSLLKRNPNVDLISFFILRTNESVDSARTHELSLIPFPTDELFYHELGSFDLVIFQNFTHRGFRMSQYLPKIRDFVKDGGGVVMIGGEQSFAGGGYANTAFADFLPVVMSSTDKIRSDRFVPQLTEIGQVHPITRLIQSKTENEAAWRALAPMNGFNGVAGLTDDGTVLLHTGQKSGGHPFVVVRDFGKGRVLAVLGDDTWRWSFGADGSGVNPHFYYRFWGNAIRWLIRDPALNRLKLSSRSDDVGVGEPIVVDARLSTPSFQPAANVMLETTITQLGSRPNSQGLKGVTPQRTDKNGLARFRFEFDQPGEYLVSVRTSEIEDVRAELPILVAHEPRELKQVQPSPDFLKSLSESSAARYLDGSDRLNGLEFKETQSLRVDERKDVPIWSNAWVLVLLALSLGTEWLLRRRRGMI